MKHCSRCGGTGKVSRGRVINGVCYKCGGDGKHRPSVFASRRAERIVQYVAIDGAGRHLAINTDRAKLEQFAHPAMVAIVEYHTAAAR